MTALRIAGLLIFPWLAACQALNFSQPHAEPVLQRLQGTLSQEQGHWLFQPCQEQRRFAVQEVQGAAFLQDAQNFNLDSSAPLFADLKGELLASNEPDLDGRFKVHHSLRLQNEGFACEDSTFKTLKVRASGHEPSFSVAINRSGLILNRPGQEPLALPYLEEDLAAGQSFSSAANGLQLELWIAPARCQDSASGALTDHSATLRLNGQTLTGCAYLGGAQD